MLELNLANHFIYGQYFSTQEREDKVVAWLSSLPEQSAVFDEKVGSSYGETLLLIAIHFHNNTLEPVVDLICDTLGIKLRPSSLTKIKILFTQQVFSERVRDFPVLFFNNLICNFLLHISSWHGIG